MSNGSLGGPNTSSFGNREVVGGSGVWGIWLATEKSLAKYTWASNVAVESSGKITSAPGGISHSIVPAAHDL